MKRSQLFYLLPVSFVLMMLFQNCTRPEVSFSDSQKTESAQSSESPPLQPLPPEASSTAPNPGNSLAKNCEDARKRGKMSLQISQVNFNDPGKACSWGLNGNINPINEYNTARAEQFEKIQIPSGATICNVKLSNYEQQMFFYDDNILVTMNRFVLASTTNFSKFLKNINGYSKYEWSQLVGKPGQTLKSDTTQDKQYCAGKNQGYSRCSFPETQRYGNIQLSFDERIIQNILSISTPNELELGVVTTGDNNDTDCQHVPVDFSVEIEYY